MTSRLKKLEKLAKSAPEGEYFEVQYDEQLRNELQKDWELNGDRWKISHSRNTKSNKMNAHVSLVKNKLVTTYCRDNPKSHGKTYITLLKSR